MRIPVTSEIELRVVTTKECQDVFEAVDQNRRHLREWLPWVDASQSSEGYVDVIKAWQQDIDYGVGLSLGIYYKCEFIGMCGFNTIDQQSKRAQIGYWISKGYEGKGIVKQCTEALMDYGFNSMKLNRIEIVCGVENKRSRHLPETLGFTEEGTMKEYEFLYDHFHDCILYSMLKKEFLN